MSQLLLNVIFITNSQGSNIKGLKDGSHLGGVVMREREEVDINVGSLVENLMGKGTIRFYNEWDIQKGDLKISLDYFGKGDCWGRNIHVVMDLLEFVNTMQWTNYGIINIPFPPFWFEGRGEKS